MEISAAEYQVFYKVFAKAFTLKYHREEGNRKRNLWPKDKEVLKTEVFNNRNPPNHDYFYRLQVSINLEKVIKAKIEDEPFYFALRYIGFDELNLPEITTIPQIRVELPILYEAFQKKYAKLIENEIDEQIQTYIQYTNELKNKIYLKERSNNLFQTIENASSNIAQAETNLIQEDKAIKINYISSQHSSILMSSPFWFYFHSFNRYPNLNDPTNDNWKLMKLLIEFTGEPGEDFSVKISNLGYQPYDDYLGKTNFYESRESVVVIDCQTVNVAKSRHLDVMLQVTTGSLLFGQYLNDNRSGEIVSGNMILERVKNGEKLEPAIYYIPKLKPGEHEYKEDINGISKHILQFLHDESLSHRRIPSFEIPNTDILGEWLKFNRR
ncbi:hypothetical protein [Larkinella sp.]|uniref:hypothetical protein n=1 Tax=Larkinella sp. TaxID=2034517 RepID=UPI003BA905B6